MFKTIFQYLIIGLYISPLVLFAQQGPGIGRVANNIMSPVSVMAEFIHSGCILIGGAFLFASVIKYFEHRRSPTMVPTSTVVFLLIAGIVLVLLPLLSYLTENGVPFTLIK